MHDAVLLAFGNPAQVGAFGENDKTLHLRHPERLALCVLLQMSIKLDIYLTCILRDLLHRRRAVVLPVIIPATIATLDWSLPVFEIDDKNAIFRADDNINLAARGGGDSEIEIGVGEPMRREGGEHRHTGNFASVNARATVDDFQG